MERHASPLPLAVAFVLALALCACQRSATPAAAAPSGPEQPSQAAMQAEAGRYYAQLVARYGQDYAACGPGRRARAGECAAAGDASGAGSGRRGNVLLMLDASGSMAGRINGTTKMAAAQQALIDFTRKLSGAADVALRVYGHTGNNQDSGKAESCAGSALLYPFQTYDAGKFESAIRGFRPTGWTPIAASLDAAARDFAAAPGKGANVAYVVSDGIETCGGDPVAAARRLHDSGADVVVNVIGFDVDADAARQLQAVAEAGGGEYLGARSRDDLARIFDQGVQEATRRYNCELSEQTSAYNGTLSSQASRYSCLLDRATREYNAVLVHASDEYDRTLRDESGRYNALMAKLGADAAVDSGKRRSLLDAAASRRDAALASAKLKRDYAIDRARTKRDGIIEPARAERDDAIGGARNTRDATLDAERAARDARLQQAREARDAGKQP